MNFFTFLREIPDTVDDISLIQLNVTSNVVEYISADKCYNQTYEVMTRKYLSANVTISPGSQQSLVLVLPLTQSVTLDTETQSLRAVTR